MQKKEPKRKVGRPPKKQASVDTIPREGIVKEPLPALSEEKTHVVEMIYCNPVMFKRLTTLCKQMGAQDICITFLEDRCTWATIDHKCASFIYMEIRGEKMNRYYCKEPISMYVNTRHLYNILQTVDKNISVISFLIQADQAKYKIQIVLHQAHLVNDKIYTLELVFVTLKLDGLQEDLEKESEYAISYEMPSKSFKKDINDYAVLTNRVSVNKYGDGLLTYKYSSEDKKIEYVSVFRSSTVINLVSKVEPKTLFSVEFQIEYVKSFANAIITDVLHIAVDQGRRIIFTCKLDEELDDDKKPKPGTEVCVVKVLTLTERLND